MLKRFGLRRWGTTFGAGVLGLCVVMVGVAGVEGCRKPAQPLLNDSGLDPAEMNMAPVSDVGPANGGGAYADELPGGSYGTSRPQNAPKPSGRVLAERRTDEMQGTAEQYGDGSSGPGGYTQAPIERRLPEGNTTQDNQPGYNAGYGPNGSVGSYDPAAYSNVTEVADQPPPPLPVYEQPPAPEPDDLWTPGYWNYAAAGYFWVPGVWVAAPYRGALWTPGYWGAYRGRYGYHPGFWGQHIGFYGGIAYGFGYFGSGYRGGYWNGDHFNYNRAVTNVDVAKIHNVYNRTEIVNGMTVNDAASNRYVNNVAVNRASYNGGRGGIQVRPAPAEVAALRTPRIAPMRTQMAVEERAAADRRQFYAANGGRPALPVAPRPVVADRTLAVPAGFGAGEGMRPGVAAGVAAAAVQGAGLRAGQRRNIEPAQAQVQARQTLGYGQWTPPGQAQIPTQLEVRGAQGGVYGETRHGQGRGELNRGQPGQNRGQAWQSVRDQTPPVRDQALPVRDQARPVRDQARPVRDQARPVRDQTWPVRDQALRERVGTQTGGRGQQGQQQVGGGQAEMGRQRLDPNGSRAQAAPRSWPMVQEVRPTVQGVAPAVRGVAPTVREISPRSMVRSATQTQTQPQTQTQAQPRVEPEVRPSGPPAPARVQPGARTSGQPAREEQSPPKGERRSR